MHEGNHTKRTFGVLLAGISLMSVLYGWIVYADEISTDVTTVANNISAASRGALPLDPDAIQMLESVAENVESLHNNAISFELYNMPLGALIPLTSQLSPVQAAIANHFGAYCAAGPESAEVQHRQLFQS